MRIKSLYSASSNLLSLQFKLTKYKFFTSETFQIGSRFKINNSLQMSSKVSKLHEVSDDSSLEIPITTTGYTKETFVRIDNIQKSEQDERNYRGLILKNGLKALLISDVKTDMSAAALSVLVGSMSDPNNIPGLAHFCEHMLFLGTQKYPDENAYTTYLSQSGGSSNAATYPVMTKYYFYVATDKLAGALDRFAQFFIAPLFTPSATEREINAVHSENEKNLSNDTWRIDQVNKHLAKKDHPYRKFATGNKATLYDIPISQNIDVRENLLEFYKKWYSSNIMSLAVIGKDSLDKLEEMVVEKFSDIENLNVQIPKWPSQPYDEDQYGQKVMIVPVQNLRLLTISFTTNDLKPYYKSNPEGYLSHLLGHEGKGSILSELRRLGWCNELIAGHQNTLNGFGFFDISLELTQEGLQHVDDIIHIAFQYLHMLRELGPQKWIFDECGKLNDMRYRFKEKEKPETLVSVVVTSMQAYPMEEVLTAPFLSKEWKPELISGLLKEFIPSKCRITLVGQNYTDSADLIEPFYQTKFGTLKIPQETLDKWAHCSCNENLSLPVPNDFIPDSFELLDFDNDLSKHPVIIVDTPILRVWHKQDDHFLKPKACIALNFVNPITRLDPLNYNFNYLMALIIKDQLSEYMYDADLAELKLGVTSLSSGVEFTIHGYNDKQLVLLNKLLKHIFEYKADEKRFNILKDEYARTLKNINAEQPYAHSTYYLNIILMEYSWVNEELLDALELVTFDRLINYAKEFFSRMHTECFLYGNINKKVALEYVDLINSHLEATCAKVLPLLSRQMLAPREHKLNAGDSYVFQRNNEFHKSSCVQLYLQCGSQTDYRNALVDLLAQILVEPCYDCLRTKEQLGYIVHCGARKINGVSGIRILVQSSKMPWIVEERIENFLLNFWSILENMPLDEFESHKESLAVKKLEKPKTIYNQFNRFYNEIKLQQYHFDRNEIEVEILRNITKEELLNCYRNFIAHNAPERGVLAVHVISTLSSNEEANSLSTPTTEELVRKHETITDITAFKSSKELYPLPMPYIKIRPKGACSKL